MRRAEIADAIEEVFREWQCDSRGCRDLAREIARIYEELGAREMLARLRLIVKRG